MNKITRACCGLMMLGSFLSCASAVAGTTLLAYDSLYRLTRIDYGNGTIIEYTYDAAGNRLTLVAQAAPPSDHIAPTVQITLPTTERLYVTTGSSVTLSGTAYDVSAVSSLSCTSGAGASISVAGTTSWSAGPVQLSNGVNKITISAADPSGNIGNASLTVVVLPPAGGSNIVFQDDFNDNSIDLTKWRYYGNAVTEAGMQMRVATDTTDQPGTLTNLPFNISGTGTVTITRRAFLHHDTSMWWSGMNHFFTGSFRFRIPGVPDFAVEYDSYDYSNAELQATYGFFITRNGKSATSRADQADVSTGIPALWDTWFDEKITYAPSTGQLDYYINGTNRISFNVGALPTTNTTTMSMFIQAYGWWTGHYLLLDDFMVTQEIPASPVETRDSDDDTMPDWAELLAGTSLSNANSRLTVQNGQQSEITPGGFALEWASVSGVFYSVNRATNLLDSPNCFVPLETNIPGLPGSTTYTDTNPPAFGPSFYRINVEY